MRMGIALRHCRQQQGGIKHYTKTLFPLLFTLGTRYRYVLDGVA